MTTETILTDEQIMVCLVGLYEKHKTPGIGNLRVNSDLVPIGRAIEQAVLQSEQVQAWKRDSERLDWLADPNNSIGNVQLPTECVIENLHSLRAAIDDAMEKQK